MRRRLEEINGQLRLLREHRSIIPTDEYYRSTIPAPEPVVTVNRDMIEILERLSSMQFSPMPVFDITPERIIELKKKDEMEKLMQDIREGRVPSILSEAPLPIVAPIPTYAVDSTQVPYVPPSQTQAPVQQPAQFSVPAEGSTVRTEAPRVQFAQPPQRVAEEPKKAEESKTDSSKTSYQQILSLLTKNEPSESDSEEEKKNNTRSFDDVFGKPKSVPEPVKPAPKPPQKTLSMINDADDSDDDFFQ
ncbi:hypothetical protein PFISCL1PPCAC_1323 [Pristionchus fissidentatus]|uniref:Uncharacterized protein n=1 Tax=Pristionchus fissidentatus TaxID=1538716 RepID=A0AAV5UU50_9BILA|nr:hypothetical protein PFISCL1PPCAC_1323 [Pristionchus fissidentatus]